MFGSKSELIHHFNSLRFVHLRRRAAEVQALRS
jgi:hypothetical protein